MLRLRDGRHRGLRVAGCLLAGLLLLANGHGHGPTDASPCPTDAPEEAVSFWKDYFDKECSVEYEDVPDDIQEDLQHSSVSLVLPGDANFTSQHSTCRVATVVAGGVIVFNAMPNPVNATEESWLPITDSARAIKAEKAINVCDIFGTDVPVYEMVGEKLDEVMGQIQDDAVTACPGSLDKYDVALHMDQDTALKVKRTMIESSGKEGFTFDLKLSINNAPDPVDIQVFVSDSGVVDESKAAEKLLELERDEDRILRDHNNGTDPNAVQAPGLLQSKAAQQRRIGFDAGEDGEDLHEDDARDAHSGRKPSPKVPVYGAWTVLDDLTTPPLCCLCDMQCSAACHGEEDAGKKPGKKPALSQEALDEEPAVEPVMVETPTFGSPGSMKPPTRGGRGSGASHRDGQRHRTRSHGNPYSTGDLFHATELPKRSSEDHAEVWARSRALVQQAKAEGHHIPDAYHFYDHTDRAKCWIPSYSQGGCGSCWAFASSGALQKQICMRAHGSIAPDLSREHLTRCSEQNRGCNGGKAHLAYEDLMEIGGLVSTDCIPYQGENSKHCPVSSYSWFDQANHAQGFSRIDQELAKSCGDLQRYSNRPPLGAEWDMPFRMMYETRWGREPNMNDTLVARYRKNFAKARARDRVSSWYVYGEAAMKAALVKYGALYTSFEVRKDFSQRSCGDGCWPPGTVYGQEPQFYQSVCGQKEGHAVTLIGYGTDIEETGTRIPYWLIENSWGGGVHGDIMGRDPEGVQGFGADPFGEDHPLNAEDQCVLAGWANAEVDAVAGDDASAQNIREGVDVTDGPPDGFYLAIKVDGVMRVNQSYQSDTSARFMATFPVAPGAHTVSFLLYARNHPKQQSFELEKYYVSAASLRCRGTGYLYSFSRNDSKAMLSWGRMTRKELEAAANKILVDNGINPHAKLDACPTQCRTGRYSLQQPCVGLLMRWGSCYTESWVYGSSWYQGNKIADCQQCTASLIHQRAMALATKQLPNATFIKWHQLVMQAFTAPDEPGWLRANRGSCKIRTGGWATNTQLNATYVIHKPYGADGNGACDERHSAPFAKGHFVNAPGFMPEGSDATVRCPMPLVGNVSLHCRQGVLTTTSNTCTERASSGQLTNRDSRSAKMAVCHGLIKEVCDATYGCAWVKKKGCIKGVLGYFKILRGYNYHGIEEGASFAIAEMDRFVGHCPTLGWSRWSTCSATKVCESGKQSRTRSLAPGYDRSSPMCKDLLLYQERSCVKPGFCPQVLMRFSSGGLAVPSLFMSKYKEQSVKLPYSTAGATMMSTAYPNLTEATYWCKMTTGTEKCSFYTEGHFQVKKDGDYMLRYLTTGGNGEVHFNALGPGKELLPQYKVSARTNQMFAWEDFGFHHRRRRSDVKPWVQTSSMRLSRGTYFARVTRTDWEDPWYQLRLERMSAIYAQPLLWGGRTSSKDQLGRSVQQAASWSNTWGAIRPHYLRYRERGYHGYPSKTEQGSTNEILLRNEGGNKVIKKVPVTKLNFTADELYAMFGVDKANPQKLGKYTEHELVIRSTVVLPDAGSYRFKYQQDTSADSSNQAWRTASRRRQSKIMIRVGGGTRHAAMDRRSGSAELEVTYVASQAGTTTFEVSSLLGYDGVDTRTALPNFIAVEMKHEDVLHGTTLDFGTKTKYISDIDVLEGDGTVRVDWPDRNDPLAGALRLSTFEGVDPQTVLVGQRNFKGFAALAEGKIDAGSCLTLNARVQGQEQLVFRGFALELCDVDGSNQYLALKSYTRPQGSNVTSANMIGWVHTEFTHPTHLQVIRSPTDLLDFKLSYKPDNRELMAAPFAPDALTKVLDGFTGDMEVGISMNTPEAYRNAEFYNISIEACPDSCTDASGAQLFCGEFRTACGTTLKCPGSCGSGGTCQDAKCFDCPAIDAAAIAGWECGTLTQVCRGRDNPDHHDMQVDRVVGGPAPNAAHFCNQDTHKWACLGTSAWGYLAQGLKCGSVVDECGTTVTLFDCPYANDVCVGHKCVCQPPTFPDDYNCGWQGDGCGRNISFGSLQGECPGGSVCHANQCCTPKTAADFDSTFECGSEPDGCGGVVAFKKAAGSPYMLSPAKTSYSNYMDGWVGTKIEAVQDIVIDRLAAGLVKQSGVWLTLNKGVRVVVKKGDGTILAAVTVSGSSQHVDGYAWEPLPSPVTVQRGQQVMILMEVRRGDKYCSAWSYSSEVSRKVDVSLARYLGAITARGKEPSHYHASSSGALGTVNFDVLVNEGCGKGQLVCNANSHRCEPKPWTGFVVASGPCTTTDGGKCVQSGNYPSNYGNSEFCEIMPPTEKFSARYFMTEGFRDILKVDSRRYSGRRRRWGTRSYTHKYVGPSSASTTAPIVWSSDGRRSAKGFRICVDSMPSLLDAGEDKESEEEPDDADAEREEEEEEKEEEERKSADLEEARRMLEEEAKRDTAAVDATEVPQPESSV